MYNTPKVTTKQSPFHNGWSKRTENNNGSYVGGLDGVGVYLDDIVVHHEEWSEHCKVLHQVFQRLREARLTINLAKSDFG